MLPAAAPTTHRETGEPQSAQVRQPERQVEVRHVAHLMTILHHSRRLVRYAPGRLIRVTRSR